MKNTKRTAILATALLAIGAVFATPARAADEEAAPVQKLANLAKLLYSKADYADQTNVVATAMSDAAQSADPKTAVSETTAALSAAVQVLSESNAAAAADVFASLVAAAGDAFAKQAAAVAATVTGNADFVQAGIASLGGADEAAAAAESPDEVLSPEEAAAAATVYEAALGAIRASNYEMREDNDSVDPLLRTAATTMSGSGIYVGKTHMPVAEPAPAASKPAKKPAKKTPDTKPSPTPVGKR